MGRKRKKLFLKPQLTFQDGGGGGVPSLPVAFVHNRTGKAKQNTQKFPAQQLEEEASQELLGSDRRCSSGGGGGRSTAFATIQAKNAPSQTSVPTGKLCHDVWVHQSHLGFQHGHVRLGQCQPVRVSRTSLFAGLFGAFVASLLHLLRPLLPKMVKGAA